ncbi:MAG: type II toxin-antitoxin system VapC family toxin [Nitrospira sp. SB0677_bin_15]|nr:type II toxin-antitoxin system VapC family toxin [Nitrospira sp. SB0667_bin_9]MYD32212.1 type II toxin-antitoxin system VapC family toxin [Nitrospira sp. SB0661_bin_20]MYG41503.1 type II toxin-antitoxin system VapC family toxin [Nitrospira sp. SB0677_bin_15]MYH01394.1 type II toxin-antitoxin system VapC family toxin [Nitrospira sp. SB0675_bin_23]MYJ23260.1 type II toxin-antitoxin system VapC family toxin [Nitrospira sp. SB0673_bin_12]
MILIDTSVWIEHLRKGNRALAHLLNNNQVLIHPFVIGEIACGTLAHRDEVLARLKDLPALPKADESEALYCIERHQLMGLGLGYIDVHLLTATLLAPPTQLWTQDSRLKAAAKKMNFAYQVQA